MKDNIPENCVECNSYRTCKSAHYGGLGCEYTEQVRELANQRKEDLDSRQ